MHIPYESLVLITACGGAIIVFFIAAAVFCICRHTRRSRKAVIHIISDPSHVVDDVDQPGDQVTWERNQLIPTARFLHTLNPNAKICAVGTSKTTWCPPVHSCALEHSSSSNTSPASPLINHIPVNPAFTKTLYEEEKPGSSTNHLCSTKSASRYNSCNSEKLLSPELCTYQVEDAIPSQSAKNEERVSVPNVLDRLSPIHNVCLPELSAIKINKRRQSFHGASTSKESKETQKSNNIEPLRSKKCDKVFNPEPNSSVGNCSKSNESPETKYSFHQRYHMKEARNFERRRMLRSQSFAGRSKTNSESHSHKTEEQCPHVKKVRRNYSVASNTRREQYLQSHRTHVRTQRVLGISQLACSSINGFSNIQSTQGPGSSTSPATEFDNTEDVIVLDGSEPPPPYYS